MIATGTARHPDAHESAQSSQRQNQAQRTLEVASGKVRQGEWQYYHHGDCKQYCEGPDEIRKLAGAHLQITPGFHRSPQAALHCEHDDARQTQNNSEPVENACDGADAKIGPEWKKE